MVIKLRVHAEPTFQKLNFKARVKDFSHKNPVSLLSLKRLAGYSCKFFSDVYQIKATCRSKKIGAVNTILDTFLLLSVF